MRPHDMKHLVQLRPVAIADVEHLLTKEKTYQGSWKRSGGRSAWFMIRRKIDRLLEMMKRPETPTDFAIYSTEEAKKMRRNTVEVDTVHLEYLYESYVAENIFAKIREAPGGEDGSVLAEVRDLRRYLLLVEAEMVSRGAIDEPIVEDRETAKSALLTASCGERRVPRYNFSGGEKFALETQFSVEGKGGTITAHLPSVEETFAGLTPWLIPKKVFQNAPDSENDRALLDQLYDDHGAGLVKLAPCLDEPLHFKLTVYVRQNSSLATTLIKSALARYAPVDGAKVHVLKVFEAPQDYRSAWRRLRSEYNAKELGDLEPLARGLYDWIEAETKFRIKQGLEYWTVGE